MNAYRWFSPIFGRDGILYNGGIWLASTLGKVLDPVWQGDVERDRKHLRNIGARNAQHLAETAGCSSIVAERVYDGLAQFAKARRPLREYYKLLIDGSYKELFSGQVPDPEPVPATGD